jgi:carbon-monoxide dehydrogenase medium subunit
MRYYQPSTIEQALVRKADLGLQATFLAGGTDLIVGRRKGRVQLGSVIDISRVEELAGIRRDGDWLRVGAGTTHAQLERCEIRALALSAETVGGPQIRNRGTVGGQLGTASPAGDVSVALLALHAEVELVSLAGSRRLPLDQFFLGPGETIMTESEMVRAVYVPRKRRSDFYKIGRRNAVAISVVMAAVSIAGDSDIGLAIGCAAPVPLRCRRAEGYLAEHGLSEATIAEAAKIVGGEVSPISDHRGGAEYRRAMASTLSARLLRRVAA